MTTTRIAGAEARAAGSCRLCPVSCERVVLPVGCLESGCSRLYSYEGDGRTWIGCLQGVFGVEIDLHRFRLLQRTRGGFGGLRTAREPLPICRTEIERTFEHRSDGPCVNPDFLLAAHRGAYRVARPASAGRSSGGRGRGGPRPPGPGDGRPR
jgi:hypothetical protein